MTSPLNANGSNFPCKGYQNDGLSQIVETYTAGSTYNMSLSGTATHNGGSCQISLSYDNGGTFRVIKSMIGGCPLESTFDFTIPSYAPSSESVLLAWSWQNNEGNREFYMNCAEVSIVSAPTRRHRHRHRRQTSFDQLPYIWKANIEGINDCVTTEGENPVYPNPGPEVVYAEGMSSTDPPASGECDAATPYGQTYEISNGSNQPSESSSIDDGSVPTSSNTIVARSLVTDMLSPDANNAFRQAQTPLVTTTTSSNGNCANAPTVTTATTVTVIEISTSISYTTSPTQGDSSRPHSTLVITSTGILTATPSASPSTPSETPERPTYATGGLEDYLPCVPGTFICTTNTTWQTCTSDPSTSNLKYSYERNVSAGMECLPWLSPATGTTEYEQQSKVSAGYYRDDRNVRARPYGDCDKDGSIRCTDGGQMFDICDQGGWVEMGAVASGTVCVRGEIVAAS